MLAGVTGMAASTVLEWYQDKYTECAANHNGLIEALEKRNIK